MNILACIIVGLVTFIGGMLTMFGIEKGLPPKTEITTIIQNTDNNNTSIQSSEQGQTTLVITVPNSTNAKLFNYSVSAHTNISITKSSKTNIQKKTNASKSLIPGLKLPLIP